MANMETVFKTRGEEQEALLAGGPLVPPSASVDADAAAAQSGGFVARLSGISLLDLIQFECLRGGQRILRVSSRGQSGYLYFRGGTLVHAATAIASGVTAVREMLGWATGSVESGMGGWPTRESISVPWQKVLLDAGASRASGTPGPAGAAAASGSALADALLRLRLPPSNHDLGVTGVGTDELAVPETRAVEPAPPPATPTVVLAPSGELLQGAGVHGLPEAASYAAHMAELIGGFLGFDRFCALEVSYGTEQLLVARGKSGNLLARREKDPAQLDDLRKEVAS